MTGNDWRKSTHSMNEGACLQVSQRGHGIAVRDSTDQHGPVLAFGAEAWTAFASSLKQS